MRDRRFWFLIIAGIILLVIMTVVLWPEGSAALHA
jgi:uncharacterized integral membrane protein